MWNDSRQRLMVFVALAAAPAIYVLGILRPRAIEGVHRPSIDFYLYFYPNILHTLRSVQEGFGLFWNPYQNCGQPFFGFSLTALFHPPNIVFFLFDRETALMASTILNMTIGGAGVWFLLRELRLSAPGAFAGAVAFEICTTTLHLSAWSPMHIGPYAWMPWALFCVERILREATIRHGITLAIVLAIQLLPGFPLTSLFTVQLVGMRILYALVSREVERPANLLLPVAIGLAAAPLLVAVQYVASAQVALESVRAAGLNDNDILQAAFRLNRPTLVIAALAAGCLFVREKRKIMWFYLAVTLMAGLLSLGDRTPLFDLYTALPLGDLFVRRPGRFLWMTSLATAVLVGFAVNEIVKGPREAGRLRQFSPPLVMLVAAVAVSVTPTWRPMPFEWWGAAFVILLALWLGVGRRIPTVMPWILCAALAMSGLHAQRAPVINARAGPIYSQYEATFTALRERMTPQDRVFIDVDPSDFPMAHKLASIFRVPAVRDYEPQTSRRFAEYTVRLKRGKPMTSLNEFLSAARLFEWHSRPLLNLAAARYLVVPNRARDEKRDPTWREVLHGDAMTVYQNRRARPRAAYVPSLRVMPADQVLETLASRKHQPAFVALVEEAPASGFLGSRAGRGRVEIIEDRGERVVLRADADKAGFVTLADQYFSGWVATVNGAPAQILRANYAFRAVEVPAGKSEIIFEYPLTPVYVGAGVTLTTIAVLGWLWRREGRPTDSSPS